MARSASERNAWRSKYEVLEEEFLLDLRRELVEKVQGATQVRGDHAELVTFEEMSERTKCREFQGGLDLSSEPGSDRGILYDHTREIADVHGLYFKGDRGVGILWTANPLLGVKWRANVDWRNTMPTMQRTRQIFEIAEQQVPAEARALVRDLRGLAMDRIEQAQRHRRRSLATVRQLDGEGVTARNEDELDG